VLRLEGVHPEAQACFYRRLNEAFFIGAFGGRGEARSPTVCTVAAVRCELFVPPPLQALPYKRIYSRGGVEGDAWFLDVLAFSRLKSLLRGHRKRAGCPFIRPAFVLRLFFYPV
ncbi:hypothetical protein AAIM60_25425, partial [Pseudomonas lijiangensis]